jgi:hypothetical protein
MISTLKLSSRAATQTSSYNDFHVANKTKKDRDAGTK